MTHIMRGTTADVPTTDTEEGEMDDGDIRAQLAVLIERTTEIKDDLRKVCEAVYGNGHEGLTVRVARLEERTSVEEGDRAEHVAISRARLAFYGTALSALGGIAGAIIHHFV